MTMTPERGSFPVQERPEEFPEIPLEIENKTALTPTPVQFKAQVKDERGKPFISTSEKEDNKIVIPKPKEQLEIGAKGSAGDALTWFSQFWLRAIKKAVMVGKQIFLRRENANN